MIYSVNTFCFTSHKNLIEPDISATKKLHPQCIKQKNSEESLSTVTRGKGREFQRKYRCEKGKEGGRGITDVNGIVSVSEGGHIQWGESLCLCLLGRAAF